ncbi:MAG: hypothetical protein HY822_18375 [Acidobacteria bacterium]|nr:hypothetical protein [Acidobacteriota bacterium]
MRLITLALLLVPLALGAEGVSQRGFLEMRGVGYAETAPNDRAQAIGEALLRYEASANLTAWLRVAGGVDARADTHRQTERELRMDWKDRTAMRPALSVRRLSLVVGRSPVTLELGKQFIRWGRADILNPTDRFAPRDYLSVVDNDFLAIVAARLTIETHGNTLDAVFSPRFTPSRTPLLNQRWAALPPALANLRLVDLGSVFPRTGQFGVRWSRVGRGFEHSLSFYEGFNHLPQFAGQYNAQQPVVEFERLFPRQRMYGADVALPLPWLTVKGEAAYFQTRGRQADEYVQYVVQLERQSGELTLVGGYAGEVVTRDRGLGGFAPDRGLTDAFLARGSYTIDTRRNVAVEAAARRTGEGVWVRGEYSQAFGRHWRVIVVVTAVRGRLSDFLGQYRRNSHALIILRYSF